MKATPALTTAEVILHAAHRTVRQNGAAKLTLTAVANEAGVSRPTVYRWFPTKELLLGAMTLHAIEEFDRDLQALASGQPDPRKRLVEAVLYVVTYLDGIGGGGLRSNAEFALQSLADSHRPHVASFASVLGDALDEVPAVRNGTLTREAASDLFLRIAYSHYVVPETRPEALLLDLGRFCGVEPAAWAIA